MKMNTIRDHTTIFTLYKSCLPKECVAFYQKPIRKEGNAMCFRSINVVGKNSRNKYVSKMMKEAAFAGFYINHSTNVTLYTDLEQLIAERPGYIS